MFLYSVTSLTRCNFVEMSISFIEEQWLRTDKKEKKIFLIYKEMQRDRVQSHIWLTASLYMVKYLRISSYIRKAFLINDFAPDPSEFPYIWGELYVLFLSVFLNSAIELNITECCVMRSCCVYTAVSPVGLRLCLITLVVLSHSGTACNCRDTPLSYINQNSWKVSTAHSTRTLVCMASTVQKQTDIGSRAFFLLAGTKLQWQWI